MANVLNRTTKEYIESANTPDFPVLNWIINPDLTQVAGFDSIYWVIADDTVSLMPQAERDVLDAAILDNQRNALVNRLDGVEDILRAFASVVVDEINTLRQQHSLPERTMAQVKTATRNKLGI